MSRVDPKIIVVGCGISGIAAAHRLLKAGFKHVRILEATARRGGRIKTGRLDNNITEIGAAYIHGASEENPVFCLARDYGLLDSEALNPENQAQIFNEHPAWVPNWFTSSGQKLSAKYMKPALDMFDELVDNASESEDYPSCTSVGHFVQSECGFLELFLELQAKHQAAQRWKHKDEATRELLLCAINNLLKVECCENATHSMDEIDLKVSSLYKDLRGEDCTFPGGYERLVDSLMSELPSDLVTYNQPVRCVHWNNTETCVNTVMVECDDGEKISADHVIITVPLGYLKKHHSSLFSPPLPAHKLHSIQTFGFGTINKIFVEFESPWWDADCEIIYLVWKDEDFSEQVSDISKSWIRKLAAFTVNKPCERGGHVLCGWIAGHEAEYMETLPVEEVRRSVTELVHMFTGDNTITPKRILCTHWFQDTWTCGSYSHPAAGCSEQDLENMMEPLPSACDGKGLLVLFAGEATHPSHYSTVHGALLTGWREADRLISHYSSVCSPQQKRETSGKNCKLGNGRKNWVSQFFEVKLSMYD